MRTLFLYRSLRHSKMRFLLPQYFLTPRVRLLNRAVFFFTAVSLSEENRIKASNYIKKSLDLLNHNRVAEIIVPLVEAAAYHPQLGKAILLIEAGHLQEGLSLIEVMLRDDLDLQDIYWLIKGIIYNALDQANEASQCFGLAKALARNDIIKSWAFFYNSLLLKKSNRDLSRIELLCAENLNPHVKKFNVNLKEIAKVVKSYQECHCADPANRVMVRVWLPDKYFSKAYGHASLQTPQNYISFWPGNRLVDFFEDIKNMRRLPDFRLGLYQLDIQKIDQAFEKFKQSGCQWRLMGEGIFNHEKTRNCSGLTYFLLQQGGMGKWRSYYLEGIFDLLTGSIVGGVGLVGVWIPVKAAMTTLAWVIYGLFMILYLLSLPLLIFSRQKIPELPRQPLEMNFTELTWLIYGFDMTVYLLSLPFFIFSSMKMPKLPSKTDEINFHDKDIYKLFITFGIGVFATMYGFEKIIEGSYKTFQKLVVTTPYNVAKLTQSAVNREQSSYPLSFLFKLPSFKREDTFAADKNQRDSLSDGEGYTDLATIF